MDMEKLAELLNVDEVNVEHGPKGYGLSVRLGEEWMSSKIDHSDLNKSVNGHTQPKMVGVAHKLVKLSEMINHAAHPTPKVIPLPVRQPPYNPLQYERRERQMQVQRYEAAPPQEIPTMSSEPVSSASLPSRFHAIVAELNQ
jgi:hypothetical protein